MLTRKKNPIMDGNVLYHDELVASAVSAGSGHSYLDRAGGGSIG